jgi:lysophospholipase L1-like esterase
MLKDNSRIVMIGDSITDCGRQRPIGEGHNGELGNGYVLFTEAIINSSNPQQKIRVTNMGVSGNTSTDLVQRWQTDVIDLKPDFVTVMIGINDIWRKFDQPYIRDMHVPPSHYRANLEKLVSSTLSNGINMVILSPYFIESRKDDEMRAMCDEYCAICKSTANTASVIFVDVQTAFDRFLAYNNSNLLAWDRVHPNAIGHMIIARALLDAISQ